MRVSLLTVGEVIHWMGPTLLFYNSVLSSLLDLTGLESLTLEAWDRADGHF